MNTALSDDSTRVASDVVFTHIPRIIDGKFQTQTAYEFVLAEFKGETCKGCIKLICQQALHTIPHADFDTAAALYEIENYNRHAQEAYQAIRNGRETLYTPRVTSIVTSSQSNWQDLVRSPFLANTLSDRNFLNVDEAFLTLRFPSRPLTAPQKRPVFIPCVIAKS